LQNTSIYFGGLNDARVQDIANVRSEMATAAAAAKTYTDGSINALNNSLTQTISSTKTELQNSISSVQSTLNTKIDNNTDTLNSRIANVSSNQQSTQSSLDSNVSRIDGRLTTIDSSMQEAFTLLDEIQLTVTGYLQNLEDRCTEVNNLAAEVRTLANDVSIQEQVMASAIVDLRNGNPTNYGAAPMMRSAAASDEVRALSYVETETDNRTIDLTALFETAEGQPAASADLR
jgi:chromosome segregation ATPase